MANQSLLLQFGEHGQRLFDRSRGRSRYLSDPQVDSIEPVEPEIPQVVMNRVDDFLPRKSGDPRLVCTSASAYFRYDHQVIRVGMKRLLDYLVGHMWTVKVAGIDMVHAGGNGLSQNLDRHVQLTRRPIYVRAGQLHGAVAHALHGHRCFRERERPAELCLCSHSVFPLSALDAEGPHSRTSHLPQSTLEA